MIESRRNNKQALYLFEPRSFVPLATVQDEKTYWYQCDQVGAPQELTDQEGRIVWAANYKVWGEATLRKTGTDDAVGYSRRRQIEPPPVLEQPFRFQGQQFDEETGLYYNRFRYYDPCVGRFVSQDPIGLWGGNNLFIYAPNPLGWDDPLGLAKKKNCPSCPCPPGYTRRKQTPGDTDNANERAARRSAMRSNNIPTSRPYTVEKTSLYGKNKNLLGPNGEPYEQITIRDAQTGEKLGELDHHKWGHVFEDKGECEKSHIHGRNGSHHSY
jgi:RHS repeat-associated protein